MDSSPHDLWIPRITALGATAVAVTFGVAVALRGGEANALEIVVLTTAVNQLGNIISALYPPRDKG